MYRMDRDTLNGFPGSPAYLRTTARDLTPDHIRWLATASGIFVLLVLQRLLVGHLEGNELTTFPWALQTVDPSWMPRDWFFNTPVGNQIVTATLIGHLIKYFGFLNASIISRLLAFALLSAAIANLIRHLNIPLRYAIVALACFLLLGETMGAREWIFQSAESKAFAYAFVLFSLTVLLQRRYVAGYALLGVATSLHFLVGGYALLAALFFARYDRIPAATVIAGLSWYVLLGSVGIYNVLTEFLFWPADAEISRTMVYLRFPHHLTPYRMEETLWWRVGLTWLAWLVIYFHTRPNTDARRLLIWGAFAMIPFMAGLAVGPFDANGSFLKVFPFRLGDTLFPLLVALGTYYIFLDRTNPAALHTLLNAGAVTVMGMSALGFAVHLSQFAGTNVKDNDMAWLDACHWIKNNTPRDAIVLAPPAKETFPLCAERASVVQFRMFPFRQAFISEWHKRLLDLTGGRPLRRAGFRAEGEMNDGYYELSGAEVGRLMKKYQSDYFLTRCDAKYTFPASYTAGPYCVYNALPDGDTHAQR